MENQQILIMIFMEALPHIYKKGTNNGSRIHLNMTNMILGKTATKMKQKVILL